MEAASGDPFDHFDLEGTDYDNAYRLLAGLVTPRPIALITTMSQVGQINAAPFSFFNVVGVEPPVVVVAPGDRDDGTPKDTARNIRETHEFVINLVDESIASSMNLCATPLAPGENELILAGLTTVDSVKVKPPRITEAPASLECREWGTLRIGENRIILGLVLHLHVKSGIVDLTNRHVNRSHYHPIGRMQSPHWYCRTNDSFEMRLPR